MTRIKERFDWPLLRLARCRMLNVKNDMIIAEPGTEEPIGKIWYAASNQLVTKLNCTDVYTDSAESGYPNKFGNYSGIMGIIQRDEAEMVMQSVRIDSLENEPIRVGPTFCAADVVLLSPCRNGTQYPLDIIEVVHKFDDLIYKYIFICLFLVIVLLMRMMFLKMLSVRSIRRKSRRIFRNFMKRIWSIYETVVGQNNYDPNSWPIRCLWIFFTMAIFILVVGVLLNLMSTDQVAQIQASRINSLSDLLSPTFAHYQPIIFTSLYEYSVLRSANPDTSLGKLYTRIEQNKAVGKNRVKGSDMTDFVKAESAFANAVAGANTTVIFSEFGFKTALFPLSCEYKPELMRKTYQSKESFAEGILATIFNKHMDKELERYLRYQTMTFNEFDFNRILIKTLAISVTEKLGWKGNRDSLVCNSRYPEEIDHKEKISDILLRIPALNDTAKICSYILSLASITLLLEFCSRKLSNLFICHRLVIRQVSKYHSLNLRHRLRRLVKTIKNVPTLLNQLFLTFQPRANVIANH